jgi:chromosome segregation ATPase
MQGNAMTKPWVANTLCGALLLAGAIPAVAQTTRAAPANNQAVQQLQQLASERTQLQGEVSKLKAELEAVRKERDSFKTAQEGNARRSRGAEAELARAQADKARVDGDLAREKQRVEELVTRFREATGGMREVEVDRATKTQQLAQREQELKVCSDRNSKLYALNGEVLASMEQQGFWTAVMRREPFLQLKRVQLENLADQYREAAQDHLVAPPPATR